MTSAQDLLPLALSRPRDAERRARLLLSSAHDAGIESVAYQAIGIVLRERGDLPAAIDELHAALRLARRSGSTTRVIDVLATLGVAECVAGRTTTGLGRLTRALGSTTGDLRARVLLRRAHALSRVGRHQEALDDLRQACATFRDVGDALWEARALNNRCLVHLALGSVGRAEKDVLRAEELYLACGQQLEAAQACHNRGEIAYRRGDLPTALRLLDTAGRRYRRLGASLPELATDQSTVLLAAGLPADALAVALEALDAPSLQASRRAELLLAAATAALARPDPAQAARYARQADRLFRGQQRAWWSVRSRLIVTRARVEQGILDRRVFAAAAEIADELRGQRRDEATLAFLLAGEVAARRQDSSAAGYFAAAAAERGRGSGLNRSIAWLGQALAYQMDSRRRGVLMACGRGLDALDEHRRSLGSPELQALATGHGRALSSLAMTHALAAGDARLLLKWTERTRATALSTMAVHPSGHAGLARQLAALRDVVRRLDEARDAQTPTAVLERERNALEQAIRKQQHQLSGRPGERSRFDISELIDRLGEHVLIELVEVSGNLHAVVVRAGRVTRHDIGPVDAALGAVEYARFQLRRVGRGAEPDLAAVGSRLGAGVLSDAVRRLGDAPVVIVPSSRLHGTPWGLVPELRRCPITVAPSAAMWMRALRVPKSRKGGLVLAAGPGLGSEGAEIHAIAQRRPDARLLTGDAATADAVVAAIDGAALAHIAAHGRLRIDNPMFSELRLHDGPLTIHDLHRVRRAPFRVVLSACDSGLATPVGADELLGLATTLLGMGSAGVIASVTIVHDVATVQVMDRVHRSLEAGAGLADSLLNAREASSDNPLEFATAATFVGLGV